MNKKLLVGTSTALLIILVVLFFATNRSNGPKLSGNERARLENLVKQQDEKLAVNKNDMSAYFDKAEYQRELGDTKASLATLNQAYNVNTSWKSNPDFMLLEARIYGQISTSDGIRRYEDLINANPVNEDYYREYINFLKQHNQPNEKIIEYYDKAIVNIKDTTLEKEKRIYLEESAS
ncbi:MAG TPA: hypothetical protein VGQ87_01975 [Patescibacteria group bacterium]|jgi:hypothetical protein|nr:hypothetical protein [Patescibacteria group bacterium]